MGYEDIQRPSKPLFVIYQSRNKLIDAPLHLLLRILAIAIVVKHRSAKARNNKIASLVIDTFAVEEMSSEYRHIMRVMPACIDEAIRRSLHHPSEILEVMIAIHIIHILPEHRLDVIIIPKRKIAG